MPSQKLQEKYILYQILNQNLESLKQQMQMVEQQLIEVKSTLLSIDDLKETKESNEVFIPLGSGCFGKGKVMDKNDILLNIGAGIFVNKKAPSAKLYLNEREKELEKAGNEIGSHVERIARQINEIGTELQELSREEKKP